MPHLAVDDYGAAFASLIDVNRARALDAGTENVSVPASLLELSLSTAFADHTITDHDMAVCCLSGVWLLYDRLDTSHDFSQQVKTTSGSFWHGIMHRREGDYSNAKYWFRNVGDHPVYELLAEAAQQIAAEQESDDQIEGFAVGEWDPFAFVDACEATVRRGDSSQPLLVAIQQREWELLFDFCYGRAIGR